MRKSRQLRSVGVRVGKAGLAGNVANLAKRSNAANVHANVSLWAVHNGLMDIVTRLAKVPTLAATRALPRGRYEQLSRRDLRNRLPV